MGDFRSFIINNKVEHFLVCIPKTILKNHLNKLGLAKDTSQHLDELGFDLKIFISSKPPDSTSIPSQTNQAQYRINSNENKYIYFEDTQNNLIVFLYSVTIKEKMNYFYKKYERAGVYLDIFYRMDFIREKILKKGDYSSCSDYQENMKNYNTSAIQTNVATQTRYFLIVNPICLKSRYYKKEDFIQVKCELTNNLVCADEDCKGQPTAKQIFKDKSNVFNQDREDLYKIYIEDVNPLIENSIILSSSIKNLVGGGNKMIADLEIRSQHSTNDVELQSGETFSMLFQILMPEIKVQSNSIKRYTICDSCQSNLHKAGARKPSSKMAQINVNPTPSQKGAKDGAMTPKPTLYLTSHRNFTNNQLATDNQSEMYLNTNEHTSAIHSVTDYDNFSKSEINFPKNCNCQKAEISNGDIHFETPLVLNFYYNDNAITSVYYPLNWSISQSQSINLTMFVRENYLKVGNKCFMELRFESFFTKTVQLKLANKDFSFSFAKSNYLIPFMSENEIQNQENVVSNNNKQALPQLDFNFFNAEKCAEVQNYGILMFMKDKHSFFQESFETKSMFIEFYPIKSGPLEIVTIKTSVIDVESQSNFQFEFKVNFSLKLQN